MTHIETREYPSLPPPPPRPRAARRLPPDLDPRASLSQTRFVIIAAVIVLLVVVAAGVIVGRVIST